MCGDALPLTSHHITGYESSMKSPSGIQQSKSYNKNIRLRTTQLAIVDQLTHPSPGFEDVIRLHFRLTKDKVLKQTEEWMAEHGAEGADLLKKLKDELNRL